MPQVRGLQKLYLLNQEVQPGPEVMGLFLDMLSAHILGSSRRRAPLSIELLGSAQVDLPFLPRGSLGLLLKTETLI